MHETKGGDAVCMPRRRSRASRAGVRPHQLVLDLLEEFVMLLAGVHGPTVCTGDARCMHFLRASGSTGWANGILECLSGRNEDYRSGTFAMHFAAQYLHSSCSIAALYYRQAERT